ncbi:MAG TPA: 50S ribosomal protein L7ae [Candidatus Krumholzibacteria bacterium]|nr:50S ribosomal protein L7ae [Candidatus Krumholzibacteria bacterium]
MGPSSADKMRALLGLAMRGRKLALGRAACRQAAGERRLALVLIARDAGASAERDGAADRATECLRLGLDKQQLGSMVGRDSVAILGVLDPHLASGLLAIARAAEDLPQP